MNDEHPDHELLLRYLDGALSPTEECEVAHLLRREPDARAFLRLVAEQAVAVADLERAEAERELKLTDRQRASREQTALSPERKSTMSRWPWAVTAASIIILITGAAFWWKDYQPVTAWITELNGPVQWTGDHGRVIDDIAIGSPVRSGTLESLSADSWGTLEFRDGSAVTISGRSVLMISDRDRKELHMRQGRLSARIQPQPAGKPMLLHTPTAELQVVGTQFNVDVEPSMTELYVNEGRVRLTRLSDGELVEVPARHQTLASLEEESELTVNSRASAIHWWRGDLARDSTYGKWVSSLQALGVKLQEAVISGELTVEEAKAKYRDSTNLNEQAGLLYAAPCLLKPAKPGSKAKVSYLVVMSATRGRAVPVVLDAGSRFRVQGRVNTTVAVTFGVAANAPGGGFAGKYSADRTLEAAGPDGNFDIEIPLRDFRPSAVNQSFAETPAGLELTDWWCRTSNKEAKLAIMHIELLPPNETQPD